MKIVQAGCAFIRHCIHERNLAANTISAYRQDLAEFAKFAGDVEADGIDGDGLVRFAAHLGADRGLAPSTIKRRIACLRTMFAWLVRRKVLGLNPFSTVEIRVRIPDRLPRCLGTEDMARLARAAGAADGVTNLATLLLFATGARVGELTAIRIQDVDANRGTIAIVGKGDRERRVYVTDEGVLALLKRYMAAHRPCASGSERLLVSRCGASMGPGSVRLHLRQLSRRAGLPFRVTPHMLRHTAATSLIEAGVDIRFVQRLLGHRNIATTQIYTHVSDVALRTAITRADTFGRLGIGTVAVA